MTEKERSRERERQIDVEILRLKLAGSREILRQRIVKRHREVGKQRKRDTYSQRIRDREIDSHTRGVKFVKREKTNWQ